MNSFDLHCDLYNNYDQMIFLKFDCHVYGQIQLKLMFTILVFILCLSAGSKTTWWPWWTSLCYQFDLTYLFLVTWYSSLTDTNTISIFCSSVSLLVSSYDYMISNKGILLSYGSFFLKWGAWNLSNAAIIILCYTF